jgi:predicted Fe-Mo cluster-binding NifX family protein
VTVAVALFGTEVSPRFGCGSTFLLAEINGRRIDQQAALDTNAILPCVLPSLLAERGVQTVICGGIQRGFQAALEERGIRVVWGVIGSAADALDAFAAGTLRTDQFVCRGRRRLQGRRAAHHRRRRGSSCPRRSA